MLTDEELTQCIPMKGMHNFNMLRAWYGMFLGKKLDDNEIAQIVMNWVSRTKGEDAENK